MAWTSRNEDAPCCENSGGAVDGSEDVARLLHANNAPPEFEPFKRKDFYPPNKDGTFDDTCGLADGCSITRLADKDDEDVCRQAAELAGDRREPRGAFVGQVAELREIRVPDTQDQAIYIYDDPTGDDRGHAVMRASDQISKGRFDEVRVKMHGVFRTWIKQDATRHQR